MPKDIQQARHIREENIKDNRIDQKDRSNHLGQKKEYNVSIVRIRRWGAIVMQYFSALDIVGYE